MVRGKVLEDFSVLLERESILEELHYGDPELKLHVHADVEEGHLRLLDGREDTYAARHNVLDTARVASDKARERRHLGQCPQHLRCLSTDVWVADVVPRAQDEDDCIEQQVGVNMHKNFGWRLAWRHRPLVELQDLDDVVQDASRQHRPLRRHRRRGHNHARKGYTRSIGGASFLEKIWVGRAQIDGQRQRHHAAQQSQELRAAEYHIIGEPLPKKLLEFGHVTFQLEVAGATDEALGLLQGRDEERVKPLEGGPEDLMLEARSCRQCRFGLWRLQRLLHTVLVHETLLFQEPPEQWLDVSAASKKWIEAREELHRLHELQECPKHVRGEAACGKAEHPGLEALHH
mmetsp:Transcript_12882/g.29237  ORF Transcript_12882/g.29237 Transcript_12882/m.29237 type:complete len:346 (-) Transcript_12882:1130-2167(-)